MVRSPPNAMADTYTAKDITVLQGLEPVRKRPGMYIGGLDSAGLHHLAWEVLDNAVDEAMNRHASEISLTLHKDRASITVSDNGRGIPIDKHPRHKKSALELILTTLHAGGKFDPTAAGYKTAGGLHGVGASVVNALSKQLIATVKRDGATWQQTFARGKPTTPLKKLGPTRGTGTTIFFHPDPTLFPRTQFDAPTISHRLEVISYLHRGVRVTFHDQANNHTQTFQHERGLADYLDKLLKQRAARCVHQTPFTLSRTDPDPHAPRIELALQWTQSTDEHLRSYVNGIPTASGGTHENGLRAGLTKAVRNYIQTHNLTPKGLSLATEDLREGLVGVFSIFITDPQFQGQTKDRLNNPPLHAQVDAAVRPVLEHWLNHNGTAAEAIVARIILAARAREASRAAQQQVTRKSATSNRLNLPGKLSDCLKPATHDSELFLVEGDSAGGSAKQGRDRTHQAILPLRGKVLNTEQAPLAKVLQNQELSDVVTALGCGLGQSFNLAALRYHRVILLADADSDGHHITTLLLTFFYRHLPELIRASRVYLAQPPLYRIDIAKHTYWARDDADHDRILAEHHNAHPRNNPRNNPRNPPCPPQITRFKGLGEMMPKVLWETTLNPKTRRLLRVQIDDAPQTDRAIAELMGKDASARFRFIMDQADQAQELDL